MLCVTGSSASCPQHSTPRSSSASAGTRSVRCSAPTRLTPFSATSAVRWWGVATKEPPSSICAAGAPRVATASDSSIWRSSAPRVREPVPGWLLACAWSVVCLARSARAAPRTGCAQAARAFGCRANRASRRSLQATIATRQLAHAPATAPASSRSANASPPMRAGSATLTTSRGGARGGLCSTPSPRARCDPGATTPARWRWRDYRRESCSRCFLGSRPLSPTVANSRRPPCVQLSCTCD